ncbi:hypothetical protein EW146_g2103 [Bondarzewia mesenterica]|uniref:Deoxyribonuclease NucA/NucB domain-containing protein n=1 Tax=Bondarzewia mesenterica TaxID=1095465 RepID=A0A4V6S1J3_9AGAM|nr:hypothetical protein EW146_g2103 [Bondarzewia mesenterica]
MLTFSAVLISLSLVPALVNSQNFGIDCSLYSDVCDTACFAVFCGGVSGHGLHYDPNSGTTKPRQGSQTTTADYRRAAIGCVNSNFCDTSNTGLSCDEFPYASTYDGGLGCFPAGFPGQQSELFQSGVTHCTNAGQNSGKSSQESGRHLPLIIRIGAGSALSNFYAQNGLANGAQFGWFLLAVICLKYSYISRIGIAVTGNQFCTDVTNSNANCPTQASDLLKSANYYQARSAPDNTYCPARGIGTRSSLVPGELSELPKRGPVNVTTVTIDDGTKWIALMGAELFKVGNTIWTEDKNATSAANATGAIDAAASTVVGKKAKIVSVN